MKRREFIKLSGVVGTTGVVTPSIFLSGCASKPLPGDGLVKKTPTICDMCFWKCAGFAYTENGSAWKVVGNPEDPHSAGRFCTRGTGGIGAYLDRDRLKTPLIRETGTDGKQTFREASWDEVIKLVANKMREIADKHGADRLALLHHGSGARHFEHLIRAYGSDSHAEPAFAQCRGPRDVAFRLTFGDVLGSPERTDMAESDCIVLIGSHIGENLHNGQVQDLSTALARNVSLIVVDPRFSVAAGKAKYWLPIRPGTDIALLLAWIHVLIQEELYDRPYIENFSIGFEQLAAHVHGFSPEWAYLQTGLKPSLIRDTAREMASHAPATLVHPGRHTTWYGDDTQRGRAMAILAALLGSWGRKGGFYIQEKVKLPKYPIPEYPEPASESQVVAHKGRFPLANKTVSQALIQASTGPDAYYKGWIIYGTNLPGSIPGIRPTMQEAAKNLEFIAVVDTMPAEVTGYADVVLPECTYLERYDVLRNSGAKEPSLALRMPAFEPRYQTKPGWWIAREIGLALGLEQYFPWKDYKEVLDWQLKQVGSSLEEMQRLGVKHFPRKGPLYDPPGQHPQFWTPSGKIELYSQQLADAGFDPMPRFTKPMDPPENYYRLNYGRMPAHTFGKTTNNPLLFQLAPENTLWVNPLVAKQWQLESGDYVRLLNQDGVQSNPVRVHITERTGLDAVFMAHGFGERSRKLHLTYGAGADDSELMTRILEDPIMGATGMRGNFVTLIKEQKQRRV